MKLLILLLLMMPVTTFSQMIKSSSGASGNVVGEVKEKTRLISRLTWELSGSDTLYMFTFANGKGATFSEHETLVFYGAKMMNNFYNAVKAAFSNKSYNVKWTESGFDISISRGEKDKVMIADENGFCMLNESR